MSAAGFTPIQLYRTTTASAVPSAGNLADGELAINLTDEALYFKNASGVVTLLADSSGALGSVTSVNASGGTTGLTFSGGPITSSGTVTLGGTLAVANGGTGVTTATGTGSVVLSTSPTLVTPALGTPSSVTLTNATGLPLGTGVTGTLAVSNGGTGATTLTGVVIGNGTSAFTVKTNPTGDFVGTTDTQTLTNKTISADDNTLSGLAASSFVLSNASGHIDGAAAQKAIPAGVVVGTTDAQTLTNKTISADDNTLSGLAASSFVLSNASGNIDGAAAQKAIPAGVVVGTTDTQTLTNKRINPRAVAASATSGNLTINGDTTDLYEAEGLTGAITFLQPSGTPVDGQKLIIRIKDNGTARSINWTTSAGAFRAIGSTLPTTTVSGKVTYVGCFYNATDGFWDIVAAVTQA